MTAAAARCWRADGRPDLQASSPTVSPSPGSPTDQKQFSCCQRQLLCSNRLAGARREGLNEEILLLKPRPGV